jgi:hypothetical protein
MVITFFLCALLILLTSLFVRSTSISQQDWEHALDVFLPTVVCERTTTVTKRKRTVPEAFSPSGKNSELDNKPKRDKESEVKQVVVTVTRTREFEEREGLTIPAVVSTLEQLKGYIQESGGLWADEQAAKVIAMKLGIQILMVDMCATKSNPYKVLASSESPSHAIVLVLQR